MGQQDENRQNSALCCCLHSVTPRRIYRDRRAPFRNPAGEHVLVVAYSAGRSTSGEPRPKVYLKCGGEYKHLPLPFGTWSVTTLVFKKR